MSLPRGRIARLLLTLLSMVVTAIATMMFSSQAQALPLSVFGTATPVYANTASCGAVGAQAEAECAKVGINAWLADMGIEAPRVYMVTPVIPEIAPLTMGIDIDWDGLCFFTNTALQYCAAPDDILLSVGGLDYVRGQGGSATPSAVLAHEVGHYLQQAAGGQMPGTGPAQSVYENQADCVAGVYMHYAADSQRISWDQAYQAESLFRFVGDPSPNGEHGTATVRAAAYRQGLLNGSLDVCTALVPGGLSLGN